MAPTDPVNPGTNPPNEPSPGTPGAPPGAPSGVPARRDAADSRALGREEHPEWEPWMATAVETMRRTPTISAAARAAEVARSTVQRGIQRVPSFAEAMKEAHEDALDDLEQIVLLRARQGQPTKKTVTRTYFDKEGRELTERTVTDDAHVSDDLAKMYLGRFRPEFRPHVRTELTGPGGGPVQLESVGSLDIRIAALVAELGSPD